MIQIQWTGGVGNVKGVRRVEHSSGGREQQQQPLLFLPLPLENSPLLSSTFP